MNRAFGLAGVVVALVGALAGIITIITGLQGGDRRRLRDARGWAAVVALGALVAFAAMERALITRDFTVEYVAEHGSSSTPPLFNFATLWSALEGSILLWVLILSGYLFAVAHRFRKRLEDPLVAWALLTIFAVSAFFSVMLLTAANPFGQFSPPPGFDGPGPNPLLQNHVLVAFHPPMLYLGYVGFVVPFAFAVGSLASGRLGEGWLMETRRWTLFAWGFLTAGIVLGGWWSYEVLGWGGYWGWDPVENASLLPWLTGTAYVHSVMVQERHGMLRVWNISLLCATFSLTILGTFLTRSGVVQSVHAFASGAVGPMLLGLFAVVVAVSLGAGLVFGHAAEAKSAKRCVVVWSEGTAGTDVYPKDINGAIAEGLGSLEGWEVVVAGIKDPEQGLPDKLLNRADVLIWWGHKRHGIVRDKLVEKIVKRVKEDGMGFISLHSAHYAKPNRALMGTECSWGADRKSVV